MGKKTDAAVARDPVGLTPEEQAVQDHFNGPAPASGPKPTLRVAPCVGCGGLPHAGVNKEIRCLREALKKRDEKIEALRRRLKLHGDTSGL